MRIQGCGILSLSYFLGLVSVTSLVIVLVIYRLIQKRQEFAEIHLCLELTYI